MKTLSTWLSWKRFVVFSPNIWRRTVSNLIRTVSDWAAQRSSSWKKVCAWTGLVLPKRERTYAILTKCLPLMTSFIISKHLMITCSWKTSWRTCSFSTLQKDRQQANVLDTLFWPLSSWMRPRRMTLSKWALRGALREASQLRKLWHLPYLLRGVLKRTRICHRKHNTPRTWLNDNAFSTN